MYALSRRSKFVHKAGLQRLVDSSVPAREMENTGKEFPKNIEQLSWANTNYLIIFIYISPVSKYYLNWVNRVI